jgi:Zn ribbon nucleic-acid-binding protein|tara:strand:+ start:2703 stop:2969 length:267 start_codon:yes stop_codon:yes gene_type:complete
MSGAHSHGVCPECNSQKADSFWCSENGNKLSCDKCGYDSGWEKSILDKTENYLRKLSHAELVFIQEFVFDLIEYKFEKEKKEVTQKSY